MAASAPDYSVATALQTAGLGTVGTNIFVGGKLPPSALVPNACIFCLAIGGPQPMKYMGSSDSFYEKDVQIIIRGDRNAINAARTKARAVMTEMQESGIGGYTGNFCLESEPNYLGLDDQEMPVFTINVRLWVKEA